MRVALAQEVQALANDPNDRREMELIREEMALLAPPLQD